MEKEKASLAANEGFAIYHDLLIETSLEKLFAAISEPDHLVNWWPLRCSGDAQLGGAYNFFFTPEYDWWGEVARYQPARSFHIKMTKSDPDWNSTSFGFDLEEMDTQVQLRFWHKGWPACNAHFRRSSYCWALLLKGLKDYLEKGIVLPFEQRS